MKAFQVRNSNFTISSLSTNDATTASRFLARYIVHENSLTSLKGMTEDQLYDYYTNPPLTLEENKLSTIIKQAGSEIVGVLLCEPFEFRENEEPTYSMYKYWCETQSIEGEFFESRNLQCC